MNTSMPSFSCPSLPNPRYGAIARLVWGLSAVLFWTTALAAGSEGPEIHWRLVNGSPCGNPTTISCGALGQFVFSTSPFDDPPKLSEASKTGCHPPEIVAEGASYAKIYSSRSSRPHGLLPCDEGSCLAKPALGAEVLVVDWQDSHGWSVAGLVHKLVGKSVSFEQTLRVGLLNLEETDLGLGYDGVGDPEVIAQLCKIADMPARDLPLVVNMSFGRKVADGFCVNEGGLECELDNLLWHLRNELGVILVGAAGNHGNMLFPAQSASVLSAGSIEIASMRHRNTVQPAAQTPAESNVLVPGYGLFLPVDESIWSAPPGSSYAAALATGWLATSIAKDLDAFDRLVNAGTATRIHPAWVHDGYFRLEIDGQPLPGSSSATADEIVRGTVGWRPDSCPGMEFRSHRQLTISTHTPSIPPMTFDDLQAMANRPCPESRPCVPCHDLPGDPDGNPLISAASKGSDLRTHKGSQKATADGPGGPIPPLSEPVTIDLGESEGIDTDIYQLRDIYLQVGETAYSFVNTSDSALLRELEAGEVSSLEIMNPPLGFATQQAYLVFHLQVLSSIPKIADSELAISIPITNHNHNL